jgi:hypothetical protein
MRTERTVASRAAALSQWATRSGEFIKEHTRPREPERKQAIQSSGLSESHLAIRTNPSVEIDAGRTTAAEILASLRKTAYTVNEVVETASVGRSTLYAHANAGSLRLTKVGTKTIVLATDLAAWLASLRDGTT